MKAAVGYLEPHMERSGEAGKGKIVLATVKGDVHDIGKNLVDIIVSNNGYDVVNLGIKQPISAIVQAATEHEADVIGMSGLLVKSTVVMRDNLAELNSRGLAGRWPVLLGGAALTRSYVEQDLASLFDGEVRYARDAFEGLRLMDAVMAVKRGEPGAALPALRERRVRRRAGPATTGSGRAAGPRRRGQPAGTRALVRSDVSADEPVPQPPFLGTRVVKGIPLAEYASYLDERALFLGQWGLKPTRGGAGPSHEELAETQGRPRLRMWLERAQTEGLLQAAVVHGYFPCVSEGDDLIVLDDDGAGTGAVHVPAAAPGPQALPGRLLPAARVGRDRRGGLPARHDRPRDQRGHRRAVRQARLPRLPGAARAVRAARRGAGRVLARQDQGGARHRRRRPRRPRRHPAGRLPGLPVLVRLPGLPGPRGPGQGHAAARAGADRGRRCPRSSSSHPSSPPTR